MLGLALIQPKENISSIICIIASMMIKCVDEEFPNPMPRVTMQMVSHNKEEEEGEGGWGRQGCQIG